MLIEETEARLPDDALALLVDHGAEAAGLKPDERDLTVGDLIAANEVFLAGSVRGVEPVRAIDGVQLSLRNEAGARLATQLRRIWMPAYLSGSSVIPASALRPAGGDAAGGANARRRGRHER